MTEQPHIIQLTSHAGDLFGLSQAGILYVWNSQINNWIVYGASE